MPKSKNKRKNGRAKGSNWNKRVQKSINKEKSQKDAVVEMLHRQMLG
jgi:hypothetical protein